MEKNKFSRVEESLYALLIICLLMFCNMASAVAQKVEKGAYKERPQSGVSSDESQVDDPSPEKAKEAAEKRQTLEELLAVPFNQIKEEQGEELGLSDEETPEEQNSISDGEVKLPPPPEQRKVERDLEKKLDIVFREALPKEYVGVSVSIRYILETVPVTKRDKRITKIKLPGFANNVWVPTQTKKIVGIVNQVRPYTTIFAVVNTPVSLFNVEVLRQTLDERIRFLNLTGRDELKMVHVPFTTPAQSSVNTLDNAAVELAEKEKEEQEQEQEQEQEKQEKEKKEKDKEKEKKEREKEEVDAESKKASEIDEKPDLEVEDQKYETSEEKPEAILEPDPEPRRVDLKAKVETTRYLLQARKAYMGEDYDAAITALRRAIELNPFSSQAFAMLGSIYYRLGWNRMALENWQHALELDPTNEGLKKYLMRLSR